MVWEGIVMDTVIDPL